MNSIMINYKRIISKIKRIMYIDYCIRNGCQINRFIKTDEKTRFEGMNYVGKGCALFSTKVGRMSYMGSGCVFIRTKIGRYCSIANNVKVAAGRHPSHGFVSSHFVFYASRGYLGKKYTNEDLYNEFPSTSNGWSVEIGNDVWICEGAIIVGGVKIGDGAIIGAGAVVVNDVPPYAIVGGVPGRVIRYRFEEDEIKKLQKTCWWNKDDDWIRKNASDFCDIKEYLKGRHER